MRLNGSLHSLYLIFASIWWGWTLLIDMFVIRILFSKIDDIFLAGNIGMELFSKLNQLEMIISTALLVIIFFQVRVNRRLLKEFFLTLTTWIISVIYFSYLTPKLIFLTELWKKNDLIGIYSAPGIPDIQQAHQYYHNLYIGIDSLKLITLTVMIGLATWRREKWE
jgi:hypothetical protein